MSKKSMKDLIAEKKKAQASKKAGSMNTVKPASGKHLYRILPSWLGSKDEDGNPNPWWHDFGQHWIRSVKGGKPEAVFVCHEKTFEKPCEVCMAIARGVAGSTDDDTASVLSDAKASQKFLVNAQLLDGDKKGEVVILEIGSTVFDQLLDIGEEVDDITCIKEGIDLIINRTGSGFDTKYNVIPSPKGARAIDASILDKLNDLTAFVSQDGDVAEQKALAVVGKAIGIMPPAAGGRAAIAAPKKDALAELDDAIDAEFEEESASVSDTSAADDGDDGDDELEAMLAGLD